MLQSYSFFSTLRVSASAFKRFLLFQSAQADSRSKCKVNRNILKPLL